MRTVLLRIARCLLVGASFCAAATFAAQSLSPAESAASAKRSGKGPVPSSKTGDAPVHWDRLDPGTIERASKRGAPKSPSFPAERQ